MIDQAVVENKLILLKFLCYSEIKIFNWSKLPHIFIHFTLFIKIFFISFYRSRKPIYVDHVKFSIIIFYPWISKKFIDIFLIFNPIKSRGESGAGKTENTKKVIQYFAFVAAMNAPKKQQTPEVFSNIYFEIFI